MGFNKLADFHVFEQLGQKMLFDVERMNFYRLDDLSYKLLKVIAIKKQISDEMLDDWKEINGKEAVEQCISDFKELGLFDPVECEQKAGSNQRKPQWRELCLDVTHQCNLSCRYCYALKEESITTTKQMSIATAERALDILDSSQNWDISFTGGEPLLNMPVIRHCVEYIKTRASKQNNQVTFSMITNGLLLDRKTAEYCRDNDISLTISFDGDSSVQDKARVTTKGGPSHDAVVQNIENLKDINISFGINAVLGPHQKNIVDSVRYLQTFGPRAIGVVAADAAPAGWNTVCEDPKFIEDQHRNLAAAWVEWRKQGPTPLDSIFERTILPIVMRQKRFFACDAGVSYLAVGPDGIMYPCHTLIGCQEMGRTQENIGWPELENRDVRNIVTCRQCWSRYLCGGDCPGNYYWTAGQLDQADPAQCRITKSLRELSLAAFSLLPKEVRKQIVVENKWFLQKKESKHG